MKLIEMSAQYRNSSRLLYNRIKQLKKQLQQTQDKNERAELNERIKILCAMFKQTCELSVLTKRYYERGYYRNEKYSL